MRKQWIAFLAACLLVLLCGCKHEKAEPVAAVVNCNGTNYTVTPNGGDGGTISDGTYTYRYVYTTTSDGYRVTFEYPDGEQYTWTQGASVGTGGASLSYDPVKYTDGMTLHTVLEKQLPERKAEKNGALILLLLLLGAVNTAWPKGAWYLETGWKFRNAEPSEAALLLNRLAGIAMLVLAGILLLV